jgi:signal transduction histidine kinase
MSNFNRDQLAETRASRTQLLISYLTIMELLLLGMLALAAFAWRVNLRLQWASRAIEQQKATLEAILNSVDDAIVGIGPEGEFLYSNPRAAELLWLHRGNEKVTLHTMRQNDPLVKGIRALVAEPPGDLTGRGLAGLCAISMQDEGQTHHYEIRKFLPQAVPGAEQGSSAIIAIADVTSDVESARKRDEYDSRIADLSRVHSYAAISGGIVHEISQPLAAIKNYIHALKASLEGRQTKAERMHLADMAGEEVDRAIQVVRNVRRLVGPQGLTDTGSCDLREAVAHAIRLVNMGRNPVPPISVKAPDHAVMVTGSLPLIGQVLVNLLRNGLEASQAAERTGAAVTIVEQGEFAEVAVSDFGAGVSPAAAQTLFTPFSMSSHGGMGLGLAICKRIADTVGGTLSWRNAEFAGAVFTFAIPLVQEERPA